MLGAGVIGSVYAGMLLSAGHEVVVLARGRRLADLQAHGLILEDAESGQRTLLQVPSVSELVKGEPFDLVLVPVRSDQLASTLPILTALRDNPDVLFFGNTAGQHADLIAALGERALFGFPAVSGARDGAAIKYVLIRQQKTMLGEPDGTTTSRVRQLQSVFTGAGFPTRISRNIDGWLLGHAAFFVPIAFALYRVGTEPARLAADPVTLRLMVLAIRQSFAALLAAGNAEVPTTYVFCSSDCPRHSRPAISAGCWPVLTVNFGSARTAGPPPRRCALWPRCCVPPWTAQVIPRPRLQASWRRLPARSATGPRIWACHRRAAVVFNRNGSKDSVLHDSRRARSSSVDADRNSTWKEQEDVRWKRRRIRSRHEHEWLVAIRGVRTTPARRDRSSHLSRGPCR